MKGYGIPNDRKGLLSWSHVSERMNASRYYWVSTVGPDGRPHSTPVDGIWIGEKLYFGGSPTTRRHRNLLGNPKACIHLENAMDVVILEGECLQAKEFDQELAKQLADASNAKYGYGATPEMYRKPSGVFVFHAKSALAWKQFPKDVTRFDLA